MTKISDFISRNKRRNKHLYNKDMIENVHYVVCPVTKERVGMLKKTYIENVLGISYEEFKIQFPNQQLIASNRSDNIKTGLKKIDPETGLTKYEIGKIKSNETKKKIDENGNSINSLKGLKTRQTHMNNIDENGLNGYDRIAKYRNETILDNGLSIQKNALIKKIETQLKNGGRGKATGASKISKRILKPILDLLDAENIKYYFDKNEYGIKYKTTYFFYDLVIPDFKLCIEFQGKNFHPHPNVNWFEWKQTFTKKAAMEVWLHDMLKARVMLKERGYSTWWIWEQDADEDVERCMDYIICNLMTLESRKQKGLKLTSDWEIETDSGWQDFHGTIDKGNQDTIKLTFTNNEHVICTNDHTFYINSVAYKAIDLVVGNILDSKNREYIISEIDYEYGKNNVYDIVEVSNGHKFLIQNGLITKNCDELAFIPFNIQEEFFASVYPTITSGTASKMVITSTPKGYEMFYKIFTESEKQKNKFVNQTVQWYDVPGRDEKWREDQIANTSEEMFDEEFNVNFQGSSNTLIDAKKLGVLVYNDPLETDGHLAIWEHPIIEEDKPNRYFMTVDVGHGKGLDYSTFCVIDITRMPYKVVARYRNNKIDPLLFPDLIYRVAEFYNQAIVLVETNDLGQQIADTLNYDLEYENLLVTRQNGRGGTVMGAGAGNKPILGVRTTKTVKRIGCANLKTLIEKDKLFINDYEMLFELTRFVKVKLSYEAEEGYHDDLVMNLVLFAWAAQEKYFKDESEVDMYKLLSNENLSALNDNLLPFGIISRGDEQDEEEDTIVSISWDRFDRFLFGNEDIEGF